MNTSLAYSMQYNEYTHNMQPNMIFYHNYKTECLWKRYKYHNYIHETCAQSTILLNIMKVLVHYTNNSKACNTFTSRTQISQPLSLEMQSTQWNVNFICHTGPRNIHWLWIIISNKLMLKFWSHAFFFSLKNTSTLKFEQHCNQQKTKNSLLIYMHLWSYASFICTPHKQSLYSLSVFIVRANTTFTTLYIWFSSTTCFSHFWPSSGRFYKRREYWGWGPLQS